MSFAPTFSQPYLFRTGAGTLAEVPHRWDVGIGGRGYMVDETIDRFGHISIPLLREQADGAAQPSERSLSPEELWRRSHESWHRGAGQDQLDQPISDPFRYRTSKGIDPWTRWQFSLLPTTDEKRSSAETNLALAVAGARLYLIDGNDVLYTADVTVDSPTWTAVTGVPATDPTHIASDGFSIYTAHGADGVYRTNTGTGATASYATGTVDGVWYVKGRLLATNNGAIYNITATGALPAALFTHPNTDWSWVGFAPGFADIYAAGVSGDKSLIYKIRLQDDATGLDVPVVAGELPDGEIVRAIGAYLGFVLIGTDKGVRLAVQNSNGDLVIGQHFGPEQAVRCFEGQGRFVWFGWDDYDAASTGLGRADLTQDIGDGDVPAAAYASDLMATAQGDVTSVVTFQDIRVFTVSEDGVWGQDTDLVASGTLESGLISVGFPADDKIAMYVDLRHEPLAGTVAVALDTDEAGYDTLGLSTTAGATAPPAPFTAGHSKGQLFELRTSLTRDGTDATDGPVINRYTLRAYPAPPRGRILSVPVILHEVVTTRDGVDRKLDPEAQLAFLEGLEESRSPVTYQSGIRSEQVVVESVEWIPHKPTQDFRWWNGVAVLRLKRFSQS